MAKLERGILTDMILEILKDKSMVKKCYLCNSVLTKENISKEHIFHNSIGGRLKSKDLNCIECNSKFGHKLDSEFADIMAPYTTLLNVKKERGELQDIKCFLVDNQEEIYLQPDLRPRFTKTKIETIKKENQLIIEVIAPNRKQANKAMRGIKRKYKQFEQSHTEMIQKEEFIKSRIRLPLELGGEVVFKSIIKIAINFFLYGGGNVNDITGVIAYLKGDVLDKVTVWHYHPDKNVLNYSPKQICHSIIIKGNSKEKSLYAVVNLYSTHQFLVLLSLNYEGPDIEKQYSYDLLNQREVEIPHECNLNIKEINRILESKEMQTEKLIDKVSNLLYIARTKFIERECVVKPCNDFFGKYQGTEMTEEKANELAFNISNSLLPFLKRGS